jgi:hypothetical protein
MIRKRTVGQNHLSKLNRLKTMSAGDCEVIRQRFPKLFVLLAALLLSTLLGAWIPGLEADVAFVSEQLADALYYNAADAALNHFVPLADRVKSVYLAEQRFGPREYKHLFGFTPSLTRVFCGLIFPPGFSLQKGKYGRIFAEEAMLLVLGRLRHSTATLESLAWRLGLKEPHVSTYSRLAAKYIHDTYRHLFDVDRLNRFSQHSATWSQIVLDKYNELLPHGEGEVDGLPWIFRGTNLFVDCVRVYVARPKRGQEVSLF